MFSSVILSLRKIVRLAIVSGRSAPISRQAIAGTVGGSTRGSAQPQLTGSEWERTTIVGSVTRFVLGRALATVVSIGTRETPWSVRCSGFRFAAVADNTVSSRLCTDADLDRGR